MRITPNKINTMKSWRLCGLIVLSVVLSLSMTACGDDEEEGPKTSQDNNNENTIKEPPTPRSIVVNVDANGKASGGHSFSKIDDSNFLVDGVKYEVVSSNMLFVRGFDPETIKEAVEIISTLNYGGRSYSTYAIENKAFYECQKMTSVMIPDGLNQIHQGAFNNCPNLAAVAIPSSVQNISEQAFISCRSLLNVVINSNWIAQKKFIYRMFGYQVQKFTFAETIERLGDSAFEQCGTMTTLVMKSTGVLYLGNSSLSQCSSLKHIYLYVTTPPTYGSAFENTDISKIQVHVPESAVEAFCASDYWMYFNRIVAIK